MSENTILGLIALGIAAGLFPLLLMSFRRRPDTDRELDETAQSLSDDTVLGGLTEPLAGGRRKNDELRQLLVAAGYYKPSAPLEFRALRTVLTLAPLFFAGSLALLVDQALMPRVLIFGFVASLLGFSLPRVYVGMRRRSRGREIARGLPLAIDLLTLCLSSGQNILDSFRQVSRQMQKTHPELSRELAITQRHIEMHSLDVAMKQWADRVQVPEVSNLALLLVQSEKLGTDTADTLVELATNFRATSRQRAEAAANRTSFWMLFPSVSCFWVAAAIILIGPAYLEFFDYRQRSQSLFTETRRNLDRANNVRQPPRDPNEPGPASDLPVRRTR